MKKSFSTMMLFFIITVCIIPSIYGCEQSMETEPSSFVAEIPSLENLCIRKITKLYNSKKLPLHKMHIPTDLLAKIIPQLSHDVFVYKRNAATLNDNIIQEFSPTKRQRFYQKKYNAAARSNAIESIKNTGTTEETPLAQWFASYYNTADYHPMLFSIENNYPVMATLSKTFKGSSLKEQKIILVIAAEMHKMTYDHQNEHTQFTQENLAALQQFSPVKNNNAIKILHNLAHKKVTKKRKIAKKLF